jgi:hypothetical protein
LAELGEATWLPHRIESLDLSGNFLNCVKGAIAGRVHETPSITVSLWQYREGPGKTKGYYWPPDLGDDLDSWVQMFVIHGYEACDNADFEPGFEKVAIYVDQDGYTSHVAKQDVMLGKWASKLGKGHDIVHDTLELLAGNEGDEYGEVKVYMKREFKGRRFPYEQAQA